MPTNGERPGRRIALLLASPSLPVAVAVLAILVSLPSVRSGWFLDDLWHRMGYAHADALGESASELTSMRGPMRAYTFLDGSPERAHRLMDRGLLPWWANDRAKISFWRPLSALALQLDYALFPQRPELMHAQSIAWFVVLAVLAAIFFRDIMGLGWPAGLAAVLYVIDDAHAISVAWLANRHAIIAAAFAVASLIAYHRWSLSRRRSLAVLSWALFGLALLSSEVGVVALAYVISSAALLSKGDFASRVRAVLPYVIIAVVWRATYSALGYGVAGSELYIDPVHSPLQFSLATLVRLPMLLLGILGWPPAEAYLILSRQAVWVFSAAAWVLIASLATLTRRFWLPDRVARFWLVGMVCAALPLCAAMPGSRNMAIPSIGGMGLLVRLFANALSTVGLPRMRRALVMAMFASLGALHLLLAPIASLSTTAMLRSLNVARMTDFGDDRMLAGRDLILVDAPGSYVVGFLLPGRLFEARSLPGHLRVLSSGLAPLEVRRTGVRTLVVRPDGGYYPPPGPEGQGWAALREPVSLTYFLRRMERLPQDGAELATLGQEVRLTNVTVKITGLTHDGRPAEAEFRFGRPLEDPVFRWVAWSRRESAYRAFRLPRVGETVRIG